MELCVIFTRWERASWTDHKSVDEFFARDIVVLDVFKFVSFLELSFLLRYPRKVSVINAKVNKKSCCVSKVGNVAVATSSVHHILRARSPKI